jgi:CBS domain-containing protein
VVDALDILFHNKVSGIALIDDGGRVTGNLSASDLRVRSYHFPLAAFNAAHRSLWSTHRD